MDSKIREMIRMAAADGVITEAERRIIIKKAIELGEDPDMVELAIEGELGEIKNDIDHEQAKGTKCPKCGALIPAGLVVCPDCSFSLVKNEVNHTALELQKDLLAIDNEIKKQLEGSSFHRFLGEYFLNTKEDGYARKMSRITSTVIPNTKADLLELLAFTAPKANKNGPKSGITSAKEENLGYGYWTLFNNCIMIARHNFAEDPLFKQYFDAHDKMCRKMSNGTKAILIILTILLLAGGITAGIIFATRSGRQKSELIKEQIEACIQNHDFNGAKAAAQKSKPRYEIDNLIDKISAQEVSYLVSQGDIFQANVVAATIKDKDLKASVIGALGNSTSENPSTSNQGHDSQQIESNESADEVADDVNSAKDAGGSSPKIEDEASDDWKESVPDIPEEAQKKREQGRCHLQ